MLTREELPECPVATTVQLIGNKWKLLILRNLFYNGKQRFTDFLKSVPGISKRVLTDNLRALEGDGIIEREVFAEVPPRVEYCLSPLGKTLKPILDAMADWQRTLRKNGRIYGITRRHLKSELTSQSRNITRLLNSLTLPDRDFT